ncbi:MAG: YggS family pyridoxal phosphate-dependent enzyme [Bacillota bacterium]
MSNIITNLNAVRQGIREAACKADRDAEEILLVAVTKNIPISQIREVIGGGATVLGENRVQELLDKHPQLQGQAQWHLIGHLQTNKVKYILDHVALIHSLDRISLAEEMQRRAGTGRQIDVLVQVNVAGEATKHGLPVEKTVPFLLELALWPAIRVKGLMTIAPQVDDPEEVRPVFRQLRLLAEHIRQMQLPGVEMNILSMGMTNDYRVAIEEGANMVRIGSAIFESRKY